MVELEKYTSSEVSRIGVAVLLGPLDSLLEIFNIMLVH
jgi:hypothetical protein